MQSLTLLKWFEACKICMFIFVIPFEKPCVNKELFSRSVISCWVVALCLNGLFKLTQPRKGCVSFLFVVLRNGVLFNALATTNCLGTMYFYVQDDLRASSVIWSFFLSHFVLVVVFFD